jgi:hypothetical protein
MRAVPQADRPAVLDRPAIFSAVALPLNGYYLVLCNLPKTLRIRCSHFLQEIAKTGYAVTGISSAAL